MVLPICKRCYDSGCGILVRGSHHNARAKRKKFDAKKRLEALREEDVAAEGLQQKGAVLPACEEPAPTQTKRKTRAISKRVTPKRTSKRSKVNASNKPYIEAHLYNIISYYHLLLNSLHVDASINHRQSYHVLSTYKSGGNSRTIEMLRCPEYN